MPKIPPLPKKGMTVSFFGSHVMRWGSGDDAAIERIQTLTVDELKSAGVTIEIAEEWRLFYREVIVDNPANPSARGREKLMAHARSLLMEDQK